MEPDKIKRETSNMFTAIKPLTLQELSFGVSTCHCFFWVIRALGESFCAGRSSRSVFSLFC